MLVAAQPSASAADRSRVSLARADARSSTGTCRLSLKVSRNPPFSRREAEPLTFTQSGRPFKPRSLSLRRALFFFLFRKHGRAARRSPCPGAPVCVRCLKQNSQRRVIRIEIHDKKEPLFLQKKKTKTKKTNFQFRLSEEEESTFRVASRTRGSFHCFRTSRRRESRYIDDRSHEFSRSKRESYQKTRACRALMRSMRSLTSTCVSFRKIVPLMFPVSTSDTMESWNELLKVRRAFPPPLSIFPNSSLSR